MNEVRETLERAAARLGTTLDALAEGAPSVLHAPDQFDAATWRLARNEQHFANPKLIPPMFRDAQPSHPEVRTWLRRHVEGDMTARHLRLVGPPGVGKTWQAIGVLKFLVQRAARAGESPIWRYATHAEVARRMRDFKDETSRSYFDNLVDADIVVFDDFGTAVSTDYSMSWLGEFVDLRHSRAQPTIYTTNVAPELVGQAEGIGDGRIASRLSQGRNTVIMSGPDLRQQPSGGEQ